MDDDSHLAAKRLKKTIKAVMLFCHRMVTVGTRPQTLGLCGLSLAFRFT